jgi:hypothetical protein
MPMVGLSKRPSGFALTHVTLKLYVTVAASVTMGQIRSSNDKKGKLERDIAIVRINSHKLVGIMIGKDLKTSMRAFEGLYNASSVSQ